MLCEFYFLFRESLREMAPENRQLKQPKLKEYCAAPAENGFRRGRILELKSIEAIAPVHKKQVITYLKLTGIKLI